MIQLETITIPAASLGAQNPLPDIHNNRYIHASIAVTEAVTPEEARYIGQGMIPTLLPYQAQDGYDRNRTPQEYTVVVLENNYLRAEFLPELGGRLRRLYDKEEDRELLYVNPVFQPGNLALRNAWFSGGVEFNVGIKGHNPLTCSPIFAERRVDAEGRESVSFYEYERIRGVVWSVTASLPDDAKALTLRCCIENRTANTIPMYWWSNIAVEEADGTRVIVPARDSFVNYFGDDSYVLDKSPIPDAFDTDVSYPDRLNQSLDFFYKIPEDQPKWIATAQTDGHGLLHYSDNILFGRKLFLWGRGSGGRHWGEYLSVPGPNYIEIQAGLAHTQLEHFPMAGHSKIEWTEGYAPLRCAPQDVHGTWDAAISAVQRARDTYANELDAPPLCPASQVKEREMLYRGSIWGNMEECIRGEAISAYFDDWQSDDRSADEYRYLLTNGILPSCAPMDPPIGYVSGTFWCDAIRQSLTRPGGAHHRAYLLLGVALYTLGCRGDEFAMTEAVEMWEKSLATLPNPWAARNLAAFYANECKDYARALPYARMAVEIKPDCRAIAVDAGQMFTDAGEHEAWLQLYATLPPQVQSVPRIQLLCARALLALDRLEEAAQIIRADFEMPDVKEGELSLSSLWFELHAKQNGITVDEAKEQYPLPYSLDFRMH